MKRAILSIKYNIALLFYYLLNFFSLSQKVSSLILIDAIGINTIIYGIIYLDFASHNIWTVNPPTNIVSKKINSSERFLLFCIKTIKLHRQVAINNAF